MKALLVPGLLNSFEVVQAQMMLRALGAQMRLLHENTLRKSTTMVLIYREVRVREIAGIVEIPVDRAQHICMSTRV